VGGCHRSWLFACCVARRAMASPAGECQSSLVAFRFAPLRMNLAVRLKTSETSDTLVFQHLPHELPRGSQRSMRVIVLFVAF
jgi:hypothetical protein